MTDCIYYTGCHYTVCKFIIVSHFKYCSTVILNMEQTDMDTLQRAQNRVMRTIL